MSRYQIYKKGDRFYSFTFVRYTTVKRDGWNAIFKCDCGKEIEHCVSRIVKGYSKTCGCSNRASHLRHGHASHDKSTKTYEAWTAMRKRCLNKKHRSFPRYGGRGISICERWAIFENFLADMGEAPKGMSLDREDNDGNYEPSNCRWATQKDQNNNKGNNTILTFNGKSLTIRQWSDLTGIKDCTISERLRRGWSVEKTLTTETMHQDYKKRKAL